MKSAERSREIARTGAGSLVPKVPLLPVFWSVPGDGRREAGNEPVDEPISF